MAEVQYDVCFQTNFNHLDKTGGKTPEEQKARRIEGQKDRRKERQKERKTEEQYDVCFQP